MVACLNGNPPDRGHSWIVLAASTVMLFLVTEQWGAIGVFLVEFNSTFTASKSSITAIAICHTVVGYLCGYPVGLLVKRYGPKKMTLVASLLASSGFLVASCFQQLIVIYVAFGIVPSIAFTIVYTATTVSVQQYFSARRALASGICMAGVSVGVLTWAPVAEYLVEAYGLSGALIIFGGLFLNLAACGLLLTPLNNRNTNCTADDQLNSGAAIHKKRQTAEFLQLWSPYLLFLVGIFLIRCDHAVVHTYLPMLAAERGLTGIQGALLVSIIGFMGVILRPISGILGDCPCINRILMVGGSSVLSSCLSVMISFLQYPKVLSAYAVSFGAAISMYMGILPAVIVDIVGMENIAVGSGLLHMSHGLSALLVNISAGLLMEQTGSTRIVFAVFGIVSVLGGCMIMLVPLVKRRLPAKQSIREFKLEEFSEQLESV